MSQEIEERPLGGNTFSLSEYPEGFDPNQAQPTEISLDQKITSRIWKFRMEALLEIQENFLF